VQNQSAANLQNFHLAVSSRPVLDDGNGWSAMVFPTMALVRYADKPLNQSLIC
jgi:hypothetical protein